MRLNIARNQIKKFKCSSVRLFLCDATAFDVYAPSRVGSVVRFEPEDTRSSEAKIKPFHATRLLRNDLQHKHEALLYDKVIVDAECTHDGSIVYGLFLF